MRTSQGRQLQLGDLRVASSQAGEGEPVVLVHGLAEDHQSWRPQLADPQGHRLLAYDLRGHGGSSLGQADGTLEQLGRDLIAILDRSGPATVVGFSLGGTIALWAAAERPDLVRDVVAVATSSVVGRRAAEWYAQRRQLGDPEALASAIRQDTHAQIVRADVDADAIAEARIKAIGGGEGYRNGATAMMHLHEQPLTDRLRGVTQPVTIVYADQDVFCPRRAAEIMAESLPHAAMERIDGAGHLVNVDAPEVLSSLLWQHVDAARAGRRRA